MTGAGGIDVEAIGALYREHADALREVRAEQMAFLAAAGPTFTAQLDDVEAEITYLLLRDRRPSLVVELGTLHGWSTTWILRALRDNGTGALRSFDIADRVLHNIPAELADGRWEFTRGDARQTLATLPAGVEYLFVDADHGARFGRWYTDRLLAPVDRPLTVSVHDVFHGRRAKPFSEGRVVLDWLAARSVPWFTAARRHDIGTYRRISVLREEIGITEDIKRSTANPMIYFQLTG